VQKEEIENLNIEKTNLLQELKTTIGERLNIKLNERGSFRNGTSKRELIEC